jgi:hypothetical protein
MARVEIKSVVKVNEELNDYQYIVFAAPFPKWQRLVTLREPHPQRVYYATWHGLGVWRWRPKASDTMYVRIDATDALDAYNKVINWKERENG